MHTIRQHLVIHLCFGLLLGAIQFIELGLNVQFGLGMKDALILWVAGSVGSILFNLVLATATIPLVFTKSTDNRHIKLGRGLLVVGMTHLGVLLIPFAITKLEYGQQALAGMLLIVWVLLGVLLHKTVDFGFEGC